MVRHKIADQSRFSALPRTDDHHHGRVSQRARDEVRSKACDEFPASHFLLPVRPRLNRIKATSTSDYKVVQFGLQWRLFRIDGASLRTAVGHKRPVPIPNTEVKPSTAHGTAWVTAWESRSSPGLNQSIVRQLTVDSKPEGRTWCAPFCFSASATIDFANPGAENWGMIDRKARIEMCKVIRDYMAERIGALEFGDELHCIAHATQDGTVKFVDKLMWYHYRS